MKVELHVHTRFSKDSFLCFWPLYIMCRIKGIEWLAITDHNCLIGALQFADFCSKHGSKLHVIPGEEIYTSEVEVIGLYLKQEIPQGLSAKETIDLIKKQNSIVYVPHPYDEMRHKTVLFESAIRENIGLIDCIEVHKGRNISPHYDEEQKKIADNYQLAPVIGSDAHTLIEIGRNYLILPELELDTPENFKMAIRASKFHTKSCVKFAHCITKFVKLSKLMLQGDFYEIRRIITRKIKRN